MLTATQIRRKGCLTDGHSEVCGLKFKLKLKLWGCDARKKRQEVSDRWIYANEVLEDKISIRLLQVQRLHAKPAWS